MKGEREEILKYFVCRFKFCGTKVAVAPVRSQEMEEMEMMDRQFQSQMGMNQMERMVNPWADGGFPPRRGMGRGQGRGTARVDSDYLAYREEPGLTGGFGRGGWSGQSSHNV